MLWILLASLATVVVVNRVISTLVARATRRGKEWNAVADEYQPTVTVVMPMLNEGAAIVDALESVLASDYAAARLDVICIDDGSTDDSHAHAAGVASRAGGRLTVVRNATNIGKRRSIIEAVRTSTSEIIVSVDSDVIVEPAAIRKLVRRFTRPEIAAVGGWVDIRNKHDNWLTRMQVVQYWFAYRVMKNVERTFHRVMHLSACLTAYRRSVLLELEPVLANRAVLGIPVKYGEDRFLTRQILKAGYLTRLTLDARCRTSVPTTLLGYLSQALRWRRSNVIDYIGGVGHVWRFNPLLAINYFSMLAVLVAYPLVVARMALSHQLVPALAVHCAALVAVGLYYRWRVRAWPPEDRVGAFSLVPYALLMVVTHGLFVPLALFTLDSGRWETRAP